jgi:hypothetical protein
MGAGVESLLEGDAVPEFRDEHFSYASLRFV